LRWALETLRVGSAGVENTLEIAARYGAGYLQASTSECYGDPLEHPQRESYWGNVNPVGPRSVYDEAIPSRGIPRIQAVRDGVRSVPIDHGTG
jgi:dTDP-glucose 4,6-dehydratase